MSITVFDLIATESLKKYTAGLSDADGCLGFAFFKKGNSYKVGLKFALLAAESVDRDFQCIQELHGRFRMGTLCYPKQRNEKWAPTILWQIQSTNELERFIPHIAKYGYIKPSHFIRLLEKRRDIGDTPLSKKDVEELKRWSKQSRSDSGPQKPKNHPTGAWLAGLTDGDGSLGCKYEAAKKFWRMRYTIALHEQDMACLTFIQKAFGGNIHTHGSPHIKALEINLGFSQSSKAIKFLHHMYPHLRMKKYRAQEILTKHKQRLSEGTPTGEATV